MNKDEVLKLANLARIDISQDEAEALSKEFGSILNYVGEIKSATKPQSKEEEMSPIRNVLREDANPHESGIHTEVLLESVPNRSGDFVEVKKIL